MSESFSLRISFYFVFGPSQANLELMYAKVIASSINPIFRWKFNISVHQWDPMKIYWFRTVDRAKKLRRRRILINWFSTVDLQSNSNRQKEKQLRAWQKKHREKLYFSTGAMRRMRGQSSGQSACPCGIYPHFYLFVRRRRRHFYATNECRSLWALSSINCENVDTYRKKYKYTHWMNVRSDIAPARLLLRLFFLPSSAVHVLEHREWMEKEYTQHCKSRLFFITLL